MKNFAILAALAVSMSAGTAGAATLTATFAGDFTPSGAGFGANDGDVAFAVVFDDSLGSNAGVLEGSEFISFSWITNPFTDTSGPQRTLLFSAPSIPGFVEGFRLEGGTTPLATRWLFGQTVGSGTASFIESSAFTYQISGLTPPPAPIPLPASGVLLLSGFAGLVTLRRRRRAR